MEVQFCQKANRNHTTNKAISIIYETLDYFLANKHQ